MLLFDLSKNKETQQAPIGPRIADQAWRRSRGLEFMDKPQDETSDGDIHAFLNYHPAANSWQDIAEDLEAELAWDVAARISATGRFGLINHLLTLRMDAFVSNARSQHDFHEDLFIHHTGEAEARIAEISALLDEEEARPVGPVVYSDQEAIRLNQLNEQLDRLTARASSSRREATVSHNEMTRWRSTLRMRQIAFVRRSYMMPLTIAAQVPLDSGPGAASSSSSSSASSSTSSSTPSFRGPRSGVPGVRNSLGGQDPNVLPSEDPSSSARTSILIRHPPNLPALTVQTTVAIPTPPPLPAQHTPPGSIDMTATTPAPENENIARLFGDRWNATSVTLLNEVQRARNAGFAVALLALRTELKNLKRLVFERAEEFHFQNTAVEVKNRFGQFKNNALIRRLIVAIRALDQLTTRYQSLGSNEFMLKLQESVDFLKNEFLGFKFAVHPGKKTSLRKWYTAIAYGNSEAEEIVDDDQPFGSRARLNALMDNEKRLAPPNE